MPGGPVKGQFPVGKYDPSPQALPPAKVMALRHFLISHGYDLASRGQHEGAALHSAWQAYQHGMDSRAWNHAHPAQVELMQELKMGKQPVAPYRGPAHPAGAMPADTPGNPHGLPPKPDPRAGSHGAPHNAVPKTFHGGGNGPGNGPVSPDFGGLLAGLLGKASTQKMLPTSLAGMAAGPDTALAGTIQQELSQLPDAKSQALANISNWFGQVSKAQQSAGQQDQAAANAGAAAATDNAKGIMASLGGSAMPGSAQVGAIGANDANTLAAMGVNDANLASELAPIMKLSEAGAKNQASARFNSSQQDLYNQLGQAQGQGQADKANALMAILSANNQSRQSNFGNEAGLLNTLASLQISGQQAASMAQYRQLEGMLGMGRLRVSQQRAAQSGQKGGFAGASASNKKDAFNEIISSISSGGKLNGGLSWPQALQRAQDIVHGYGWNPYNPAVIGSILRPAMNAVGVNFTDPTAYNG